MSRALAYTWGKFVNIAQLRRHPARAIVFTTAFVGVLAVAMMPLLAQAVDLSFLAGLIATALSFFVEILGKLLLLIIYILTQVAQYNDFIKSTAVSNGWVIVRDVANMFFIVILLVTAFATILNVESYQWKQILPKLLIAAVLINFSKTIAGIFIDISQVVMLTFVNGFAAAAGGNFTNAFQISNLLTLDPDPNLTNADVTAILGGYVLALLMLVIAIGITIIMTIMLLFRIVMLWALVVLSPLPYLLKVIPGKGSGMADRWWKDFSENLIAGPVLAFFLWLALVSVGSGNVASQDNLINPANVGGKNQTVQGGATIPNPGGSTAGTPESFMSFLIAICMLIAGTKIAGEYSVTGAGALNKFREGLGKKGMGALKVMTGARYVGERYAGFQAMRESARKDKVQGDSAKIMGAYGSVLQLPGAIANKGLAAVGKGAGWVGKKTGLDKVAAKIGDAPGIRQLQFEKRAKEAEDQASLARGQGKFEDAKKLQTKAYNYRAAGKWARRGVTAGSVIMAPVTGGLSLLGAVPAAIGQATKAGKAAQGKGKSYKYDAAMKELDALKDAKKDDVMKNISDGTLSNAARQANFLKATKEGWHESSDVEGGEDTLRALGADDKTVSTFKSYAEGGHYAGTMLKNNRDERQRRLAAGRMSMKDIKDSELKDPDFAADIVLNVRPESRKDLKNTDASKNAFKSGLEGAMTKAVEDLGGLSAGTLKHEEKQKQLAQFQSEYMGIGGDITKAFGGAPVATGAAPGIDYGAFGRVVAGKGGGEIIANMDVTLMADTKIMGQIADNADTVQIQYALKKAVDDGDRDRAQALRKLVGDIKKKLHDDMDAMTAPGTPMLTEDALAVYQDKEDKLERLRGRTFKI